MTTIRNFTDVYHKEYDEYKKKIQREDNLIAKNNAKIETAKRSIERAKKRRSKIKMPFWTERIIKEIGKEMLQYFPDYYILETMGPFGLSSRVAIWISHPKWDVFKNKNYPHYSFDFTPDLDADSDANLRRVDYNTDTGEYPKGSIGEINGFNHPNIPISNNTSILELIKLFYPEFKPFKNESI